MSQLVPDHVFLGILASQPCHGYDLLAHFRDPARLGKVWSLSTSQLYAVLKRLEQQMFIKGIEMQSADAPPRIEYSVTDSGKLHFEEWLMATPSASIRCIRVEFLSRLYIIRLLNRPALKIVQQQNQVCQAELARLMQCQEQIEPGIGFLADALVIEQLNAVLNWIDRCELVPLEGIS